ncbi:hypothetical protein BS47DRAFT_1365144 [Hydnum rufescens UP504]|uniref:Uncharacterized protein n=1 Tax=Hydnum rufescens UP504 TaxID=1448309 RepID=A0A9P6APC8_9AGAM|nr:hypothetical protein BS47DRAFT_1365144 [Hydnum rufescens UP504]
MREGAFLLGAGENHCQSQTLQQPSISENPSRTLVPRMKTSYATSLAKRQPNSPSGPICPLGMHTNPKNNIFGYPGNVPGSTLRSTSAMISSMKQNTLPKSTSHVSGSKSAQEVFPLPSISSHANRTRPAQNRLIQPESTWSSLRTPAALGRTLRTPLSLLFNTHKQTQCQIESSGGPRKPPTCKPKGKGGWNMNWVGPEWKMASQDGQLLPIELFLRLETTWVNPLRGLQATGQNQKIV